MTASSGILPFGTFCPTFPWGTPAVDSLICTLDARNVGPLEIIVRVKKQFPALANVSIPREAVERRILILDQIVELDYFKYGIGLAGAAIDFGHGDSRAVKHGIAIHANTGEPWEKIGIAVTKSETPKTSLDTIRELPKIKMSTDSLRRRPSGRGARLGHAIHMNQGQPWQVMGKMQDLGREKSIESTSTRSNETIQLEDPVPRPLSPARADNVGRPSAVERSLRLMRSFEEDRPSREEHRVTKDTKSTTKMQVSPFPKIIRIQPSETNVDPDKENLAPQSVVAKKHILSKKSNASLKTSNKPLKKKSIRQLNIRPVIHVTQPSQERIIPWENPRTPPVPPRQDGFGGPASSSPNLNKKVAAGYTLLTKSRDAPNGEEVQSEGSLRAMRRPE